jgi:hypothetical protein
MMMPPPCPTTVFLSDSPIVVCAGNGRISGKRKKRGCNDDDNEEMKTKTSAWIRHA